MMFTCMPRAVATTRSASRKVIKRGNTRMSVDLHCHVQTPAADELAKRGGEAVGAFAQLGNPRSIERQKQLRIEIDRKLTSIEQRLADMDKQALIARHHPVALRLPSSTRRGGLLSPARGVGQIAGSTAT